MGARRISEGAWSKFDANGVFLSTGNGADSRCCNEKGPIGYWQEPANVDVLGATAAIRRTMTDVGWVAGATMTVGAATGSDNVALAAASLTGGAVSATNTVLFTTVLGSAAYISSVVMRRKTGTGTIEMTDNGGTNWVDVTAQVGASYAQIQLPVRTQANPVVGFRITTNGDAVEVDFNTVEVQQRATARANPTPIPVNVSKARDVLTFITAGNLSGTVGACYAEFTTNTDSGFNPSIVSTFSAPGGAPLLLNSDKVTLYDDSGFSELSAAVSPLPTTAVQKAATSWSAGRITAGALNGVSSTGTYDGNLNLTATVFIGGNVAAGSDLYGAVSTVRNYGRALSPAQLEVIH